MKKLIDELDFPETKKATILDAIYWVDSAWKKVTPETIRNCFKHAGHEFNENDNEEDLGLFKLGYLFLNYFEVSFQI